MEIGNYSFIHDDITWCGSDCDNTECFRHPSNMMVKEGVHSFADFIESKECPVINLKEQK